MTSYPTSGPYGADPASAYPPDGNSYSAANPAYPSAGAPYPPAPAYPPAGPPVPAYPPASAPLAPAYPPVGGPAGPSYPATGPAGWPPAGGQPAQLGPAQPPAGGPSAGPGAWGGSPVAPAPNPSWPASDQPVTHPMTRTRKPTAGAIWGAAVLLAQVLRWTPGLSEDVKHWLLVNLRSFGPSTGPLVFNVGWAIVTFLGLIVVLQAFVFKKPFYAIITHPGGLGLMTAVDQPPQWYQWGQVKLRVQSEKGLPTGVAIQAQGQREFTANSRNLSDFPLFMERLRQFTAA